MMHPGLVLAEIGKHEGRGVFAAEFIPRGTVVWVPSDTEEILTPERHRDMSDEELELWAVYAWVRADGEVCLCGDAARYVNHSCDANMASAGMDATLASRNVQPGDEVTEDYLLLNRTFSFRCKCGSSKCRGRVDVSPSWRAEAVRRWDAAIPSLLSAAASVEQPLWGLVGKADRERFANPETCTSRHDLLPAAVEFRQWIYDPESVAWSPPSFGEGRTKSGTLAHR